MCARSRLTIVASMMVLQAVLLLFGGVMMLRSVNAQVIDNAEARLVADATGAIAKLARDFEANVSQNLDLGSSSWAHAQDWIEGQKFEDGASVAILDEQGDVLLHPALRTSGALDTHHHMSQTFCLTDCGTTIPINEANRDEIVVGTAVFVDGNQHLIATTGVLDKERLVLDRPIAPGEAVSLPLTGSLVGAIAVLAVAILGLTGLSTLLIVNRYHDQLEGVNAGLEAEVAERVAKSLGVRDALIFGLAKLADYRDNDTGAHLDRIGVYADLLAVQLRGTHPEITDEWTRRLVLASSLHDIGKVGIPDAVLLKPGRLDADERKIMEKHPLIGADTLIAIRRELGEDPFIEMGIEVALQHHEKWDGTGYPFGIAGDTIALSARIIALADFYDAVTSERVYKEAMSHAEAADLIARLHGKHFDPAVADAFARASMNFDTIRRELQPSDPENLLPRMEKLLKDAASESGHAA